MVQQPRKRIIPLKCRQTCMFYEKGIDCERPRCKYYKDRQDIKEKITSKAIEAMKKLLYHKIKIYGRN